MIKMAFFLRESTKAGGSDKSDPFSIHNNQPDGLNNCYPLYETIDIRGITLEEAQGRINAVAKQREILSKQNPQDQRIENLNNAIGNMMGEVDKIKKRVEARERRNKSKSTAGQSKRKK